MSRQLTKIYSIPRQFVIAWIISFLCMLGLTGGSMLYATHVDRRSNQQWCELIISIDTRYQALSPDAPIEAKEFAVRIHHLRNSLECK